MMRWRLTASVGPLALIATFALAAGERDTDDDVEAGTIGTGIMGEITGLGSIHVNGVRIGLPDELPVTSVLGDRPAAELAVGETVVVEATPANGALTAHRIRNYYPLVAPIREITGQRLRLLNLDLDISGIIMPDLAVGDWVAVSGLWRGATVAVSHVRPVGPRDRVVVSATFSEAPDRTQRVGPFALAAPRVVHAEEGAHLRVSGTWSDAAERLEARVISSGLFADDLQSLLIEGYLSQPDAGGAYYIHGAGIVFVTDTPEMQVSQSRGVFCVSPGRPATFSEVVPLEMARPERRQMLEDLIRSGGLADC